MVGTAEMVKLTEIPDISETCKISKAVKIGVMALFNWFEWPK